MADFSLNLAIVAGVSGLLSLDRRAALQLMISQPLVAVSVIGWIFGEASLGVMLGAYLQLLWMSCVLFGSNIPRNDTLASVTIAGAIFLYGRHVGELEPAIWSLAILIGAPTCIMGQWLDIKLDHLNLGLANQADEAARNGSTKTIAFLVFLALVRTFCASATATAVLTAGLLYCLATLQRFLTPDWTEVLVVIGLYLVPSLGIAVALSMLRHRRGIILASVTFAVVAAILTQGYAA